MQGLLWVKGIFEKVLNEGRRKIALAKAEANIRAARSVLAKVEASLKAVIAR